MLSENDAVELAISRSRLNHDGTGPRRDVGRFTSMLGVGAHRRQSTELLHRVLEQIP